MRDHELRASLAAIGQLQPGLEWEGELVDGRRRQPLCIELGVSFNVTVCHSLKECCSTLWPAHPARALDIATRSGVLRVLELAEICGTTSGAVALVQEAMRPNQSAKRRLRERAQNQARVYHMVRRTITFEPELLEVAREACKVRKKNLAQLVRDALWKAIKDVPGAPRQQPRRVQPQNRALRRIG